MKPVLLGSYRLIAKLGRGRVTDVYLAAREGQSSKDDLVVLKRLRSGRSQGDEARTDDVSVGPEADLAPFLQHPHIATVHEVNRAGPAPFWVMDYIEGQPLDRVLATANRSGGLPVSFGLRILCDLLSALDYAHNLVDDAGKPLGIVHRDVRPHNIFISYQGDVKLLDFGIPRPPVAHADGTTSSDSGRTYLAPEQAFAGSVDRRSDVFAVGLVMWELLSKQRRAIGEVPVKTMQGLQPEHPTEQAAIDSAISAELAEINDLALEREPDKRYATAEEMRLELEDALERLADPRCASPQLARASLGGFMQRLFKTERSDASRRIQLLLAVDTLSGPERPAAELLKPTGSNGAPPALRLSQADELAQPKPRSTMPPLPRRQSRSDEIMADIIRQSGDTPDSRAQRGEGALTPRINPSEGNSDLAGVFDRARADAEPAHSDNDAANRRTEPLASLAARSDAARRSDPTAARAAVSGSSDAADRLADPTGSPAAFSGSAGAAEHLGDPGGSRVDAADRLSDPTASPAALSGSAAAADRHSDPTGSRAARDRAAALGLRVAIADSLGQRLDTTDEGASLIGKRTDAADTRAQRADSTGSRHTDVRLSRPDTTDPRLADSRISASAGRPERMPNKGKPDGRGIAAAAAILLVLAAVGLTWSFTRPDPRQETQTAAVIAAPDPAAKPVLRLCGSNTVGAELAPALVEALFASKDSAATVTHKRNIDSDVTQLLSKSEGKTLSAEITARGTATGFAGLAEGACDVGMASRAISPDEAILLHNKGLGDLSSPANEHVIALDGVAVVVHPNNPLHALDRKALHDIFTGKVNDWAEVGGTAGPIHVNARDDQSGTYDTFHHLVLGEDKLVSSAKRYARSDALADAVASDPAAVGFVGLAYVRTAKALAVGEAGAAPLLPTQFTVATEGYMLSRRLYLYTPDKPSSPWVSELVNFAMSARGQEIAGKAGFVNLSLLTESGRCSGTCPARYQAIVANAQRVSVDVRFRSGSNQPDSRARRDMDRLVTFLQNFREAKVLLLGFSDSVGSVSSNLRLSEDRAKRIAEELSMRGIRASVVTGFGAEMPVASNDTESGRQRNRRVEVWFEHL